MDFEVLIDERLIKLAADSDVDPAENKEVLSLVNDYEDGNWRYTKFHRFIWDNIALTCRKLPRQAHS